MVPPVAVIGDAFNAVVVAVADVFIVAALASAPTGSGSVGGVKLLVYRATPLVMRYPATRPFTPRLVLLMALPIPN